MWQIGGMPPVVGTDLGLQAGDAFDGEFHVVHLGAGETLARGAGGPHDGENCTADWDDPEGSGGRLEHELCCAPDRGAQGDGDEGERGEDVAGPDGGARVEAALDGGALLGGGDLDGEPG